MNNKQLDIAIINELNCVKSKLHDLENTTKSFKTQLLTTGEGGYRTYSGVSISKLGSTSELLNELSHVLQISFFHYQACITVGVTDNEPLIGGYPISDIICDFKAQSLILKNESEIDRLTDIKNDLFGLLPDKTKRELTFNETKQKICTD